MEYAGRFALNRVPPGLPARPACLAWLQELKAKVKCKVSLSTIVAKMAPNRRFRLGFYVSFEGAPFWIFWGTYQTCLPGLPACLPALPAWPACLPGLACLDWPAWTGLPGLSGLSVWPACLACGPNLEVTRTLGDLLGFSDQEAIAWHQEAIPHKARAQTARSQMLKTRLLGTF